MTTTTMMTAVNDLLCGQMEKNRLKEEQEKRLQDERTKFIEKTKNLLIFEPVEDEKPKRSTAPAKVCPLTNTRQNLFKTSAAEY